MYRCSLWQLVTQTNPNILIQHLLVAKSHSFILSIYVQHFLSLYSCLFQRLPILCHSFTMSNSLLSFHSMSCFPGKRGNCSSTMRSEKHFLRRVSGDDWTIRSEGVKDWTRRVWELLPDTVKNKDDNGVSPSWQSENHQEGRREGGK